MRIDASLFGLTPSTTSSTNGVSGASFSDTLSQVLQDVNEMQLNVESVSVDLALGNAESLHDVLIATEKAHLALELTVAVRNRVVAAYQEISRMQL